MTDLERLEIKAQLIGLGFWGADEPGDPVANHHDASILNQRVDALLAMDVFLVSTTTSSYSSVRQILILHWDREYTIVDADNYPEAISLAALALPEFLKDHPECAAAWE